MTKGRMAELVDALDSKAGDRELLLSHSVSVSIKLLLILTFYFQLSINKRNKDKLICADLHITCTWRDR